ncbi:MAG: endonuclease/exonuclease/phosphatase family protein [Thermoleophilia bacterium]|nr:endonuclease/exonuclease/phosphatase family protein [Thermoleophilia bacterium]
MLVRSWNLFHGNSVPPQRREFLDEMIRLATSDDPDVLCVQEVPVWALGKFSVSDVAARPSFGPLPITAELGRQLTEPNHGLFRSAFAGQGNAMVVSSRLRVLSRRVLTLNPRRFRSAQARALGLAPVARLGWAKERRIVQALRLAAPGGRTYLVTNMHCTSFPADERLADAELLRAAWFAMSSAAPDDVVVLAGDFNARAARSRTLHDLASPEWGFSAAGPGIDHILVRGADPGEFRRWPDGQRKHDGVLLSDHAPVELEFE